MFVVLYLLPFLYAGISRVAVDNLVIGPDKCPVLK
jgi:hypothetical protein